MVKSTQIFTAKNHQKKGSPYFSLKAIVLISVCKIKNEDDKYLTTDSFGRV